MENIDGSYAVEYGGGIAGTLHVFGDGGFTVFEFRGESCGTVPLRLCCLSGGRLIPIGIPVPDRGEMYLRKRFTKNGLASAGISGIDGASLISLSGPVPSAPAAADKKPPRVRLPAAAPAEAEWQCEYEPWALFTDDDIKKACLGLNGALRRRRGGADELAVPVSPCEPFPMMPVFCFGDIADINGRQYVVFTVKDGKLV